MIDNLLRTIVKLLNDKKANDIRILKVDELSTLADYFVIADSNNRTHVKSLADDVEEQMKKKGFAPKRIEKDKGGDWTVLDFGNIILHIFLKSARDFYNLEKLWEDATGIDAYDIV